MRILTVCSLKRRNETKRRRWPKTVIGSVKKCVNRVYALAAFDGGGESGGGGRKGPGRDVSSPTAGHPTAYRAGETTRPWSTRERCCRIAARPDVGPRGNRSTEGPCGWRHARRGGKYDTVTVVVPGRGVGTHRSPSSVRRALESAQSRRTEGGVFREYLRSPRSVRVRPSPWRARLDFSRLYGFRNMNRVIADFYGGKRKNSPSAISRVFGRSARVSTIVYESYDDVITKERISFVIRIVVIGRIFWDSVSQTFYHHV